MNKTKNVPVLNELKKLGKFGYSLVSNWFHILSAIWAQSWTNFHNDMESIDLRVYKISVAEWRMVTLIFQHVHVDDILNRLRLNAIMSVRSTAYLM